MLLGDLIGAQRIVSHDHGQLALHTSSAGIVDGRNTLAAFMCDQSEAEWLLMVDSDMGFSGDTLEQLIAVADPTERPVVGALCFGHRKYAKSSFHGTQFIAQPTMAAIPTSTRKTTPSHRASNFMFCSYSCAAESAAATVVHCLRTSTNHSVYASDGSYPSPMRPNPAQRQMP
jgi:hypothetical protein